MPWRDPFCGWGSFVARGSYSANEAARTCAGGTLADIAIFDPEAATEKHPRFGGKVEPPFAQDHSALADGASGVLAATRGQLRHDALQIKILFGGGYSSPADPLLSTQYTPDEIETAVAEN